MIRHLGAANGGQVLVVNPTNTARLECFTFTLVTGFRSTGEYTGLKDALVPAKPAQPIILASESAVEESFELPNTNFREVTRKRSSTYMAQIQLPPNGIALLEPILDNATHPQQSSIKEIKQVETASLENQYLSLVFNGEDGSCTLTHKGSGQSWSNVNKLWRTKEAGSAYLHRANGAPEFVSDLRIVSQKRSFLFSSIHVEGKLGTSAVSITYVLFAKARSLQIQTSINNSGKNSYVVTTFPVRTMEGKADKEVQVDADGNFEYVDRSKMTNRYVAKNRFTSLYSSGYSLTVANRGTPEYKVGHDDMQMTLIRGVDNFGDWIFGRLEDDISQELGNMTFQYAVIPDACRVTEPSCAADLEARNFVDPIGSFANWVEDGYRPERYIDMDVSPLSVVSALPTSVHDEETPQLDETTQSVGPTQLFNLVPEKLILSAVKKAESKGALVVRAYNPTDEIVEATLSPGLIKFSRVECALLNENKMEEKEALEIMRGKNGEFQFAVAASKIVTLLLYNE